MPSEGTLAIIVPYKKSEGPVDIPSLLLVWGREGKPLKHLLTQVQISHPAGTVTIRGCSRGQSTQRCYYHRRLQCYYRGRGTQRYYRCRNIRVHPHRYVWREESLYIQSIFLLHSQRESRNPSYYKESKHHQGLTSLWKYAHLANCSLWGLLGLSSVLDSHLLGTGR